MKNDEAIKILEEETKRIFINRSTVIALNLAINALKHEEEYRWHDLRKDPFDLPSRKDLFLITYKSPYNGTLYTNLEVYFEQEKEWGVPMDYEVVAWKELETLI